MYLVFPTKSDADLRDAMQVVLRKCTAPTFRWWHDAVEVNGLWYMDVSYGKDDGGIWLTDEEQLRVELELPNLSETNNENE